MMNWVLLLQQAGLPAVTAEEVNLSGLTGIHATFSRELTVIEWEKYSMWTRSAAQSGEVVDFRAFALSHLNTWRGNQRGAAGLTVAVLQELVYIGKFLEAQRWLAAQDTDFGMANEAIAWGLSNVDFANVVVTQRNTWMAASDQVEATYRSYKNAVEAASTVEEIAALLAELG